MNDRHTTIPVKVNAWVDEGIEPVVSALARNEGIVTVDSCEGGDGKPAYVYFVCDSGDENLFRYLVSANRALHRNVGDFCLRLEWGGGERPMARLDFPPQYTQTVARWLEWADEEEKKKAETQGVSSQTKNESQGRKEVGDLGALNASERMVSDLGL